MTRNIGVREKTAPREPVEFEGRPKGSDNATGMDLKGSNSNVLAPYVVLSASRYDRSAEQIYQGSQDVGALTYALTEVMGRGQSLSYGELHRQVKELVQRKTRGRQAPQIEGDTSLVVLGQELVDPNQVLDFGTEEDPTKLWLGLGELHGVFEGTRLEVHPLSATQPHPETLLVRGKVEQSSTISSSVILERPVSVNPKEHRVFITHRSLGRRTLRVSTSSDAESLRKSITSAGELMLNDADPEVQISLSDAGFRVQGQNLDETFSSVKYVIARLRHRALSDFVRELSMYAPDIRVALRARPCDPDHPDAPAFEHSGQQVSIPIQLQFCLVVENLSDQPIQFSAVVITRDDTVYQLYPEPPGGTAEPLPAGGVQELGKIFQINGRQQGYRLEVKKEDGIGLGDHVRLFAFPAEEGKPKPPRFHYEARVTQARVTQDTPRSVDTRESPDLVGLGTSVTLEMEFFKE
jgi:hypothetical protein